MFKEYLIYSRTVFFFILKYNKLQVENHSLLTRMIKK
jgi:hypothetical protein